MDQREIVDKARFLRQELVSWHGKAGSSVKSYVEELQRVRQDIDNEMAKLKAEVAEMRARIRSTLHRCDVETSVNTFDNSHPK